MAENPYAPSLNAAPVHVERSSALRTVRLCTLILSVGAVYNAYVYSGLATPTPAYAVTLLRGLNITGVVLIITACWFFALPLFELVSLGCHRLFGRSATLDQWRGELYRVLATATPFAILGTIVWCVWVYAFYFMDMNFFLISVPTGIAAHVLAACVYLRIPFKWWSLEKTAANNA